MNERISPETGALLRRDVRPMTLSFKGETVTFGMPGWYSDTSDESVHSGADLRVSDQQLNLLKARAEGLLEPTDIRRIRKKLYLTQAQAGTLIGGGPRAFQKYEAGDLLPSRAISSALTLLDRDPTGLDELRSRQAPDRVARTAPAGVATQA
jgi:HTH-type transcriptional regulator / antitoxin MqsA